MGVIIKILCRVQGYCSNKLIPYETERFDPVVSCFCCSVAETSREADSSPFYLTKDTFGSIQISIFFVSEIVAYSSTCSL